MPLTQQHRLEADLRAFGELTPASRALVYYGLQSLRVETERVGFARELNGHYDYPYHEFQNEVKKALDGLIGAINENHERGNLSLCQHFS